MIELHYLNIHITHKKLKWILPDACYTPCLYFTLIYKSEQFKKNNSNTQIN